jgi:hypothetical protein
VREELTFTLDVSGRDQAAISVMHAYMQLRGVDPEHEDGEGQEGPILRRWRDAAQALADEPDEGLSSGCLNAEAVAEFAARLERWWPTTAFDFGPVLLKEKHR